MQRGSTQSRVSPILLDRPEAAEALNLSLRKIDHLIDTGKITPVRIGGRVRIAVRELERFIASEAKSPISRSKQLKLVRESAGLTPEQLESLCHLEPGTVLAVEQGHTVAQHIFALMVGSAIYAGLINQEAVAV